MPPLTESIEAPGQRNQRTLLAEAKRIRAQVSDLKRQIKARPEDAALREEFERLRARYQRIEQLLAQPDAPRPVPAAPPQSPTESPTAPPAIDPALLEPRSVAPLARRPVSAGFSLDWEDAVGYITGGIRILRIVVTSVLLLFILAFGYLYFVQDMRFFIVPTRSMQPTLNPMDRIVTLAAPAYERGDIVVFPDPDHPGDYLAKRIVALGGDTVAVSGRTLIVNDQPVEEPYIAEAMDFGMHAFVVPARQAFVLGDNRNASEDSKDWERGVPMEDIRGRVWAIYMPLDRFQWISRAEGSIR